MSLGLEQGDFFASCYQVGAQTGDFCCLFLDACGQLLFSLVNRYVQRILLNFSVRIYFFDLACLTMLAQIVP